jgi:hypothetical protein
MDIPILTKEQVDEVDAWLASTKPWFPLSQDDHTKWRMLKKCLPILSDPLASKDDFIRAVLGYQAVAKAGIPNDLLCEMNLTLLS